MWGRSISRPRGQSPSRRARCSTPMPSAQAAATAGPSPSRGRRSRWGTRSRRAPTARAAAVTSSLRRMPAIATSGGGIAANGDSGTIVLTTTSPVPSGDITVGSPLSAQATDPDPSDATGSGTITIQAAGSIAVNKALWVTGNGGGDSAIDLEARGDIALAAPVTGNDPAGGGTLSVHSGRNTTVAATVQMRSGTGDVGSGGTIEIAAGGDVTVTGTGTQLDVTGASGDGGTIALAAEGNVTVNAGTQLLADSTAAGGTGGFVRLSAGTRCDARLCDPTLDPTPARDVAGSLTLGGKVSATPGPSSQTELAGCGVTLAGSALVTSGGGT